MTHIGGTKGGKEKTLWVVFFFPPLESDQTSYFIPSLPALCFSISFRTSSKWLLWIGRSWFCVWGKDFWDFFGRTEWDIDSAVSLHRRWNRGWDPGGSLQVSAGKEPPAGGNDSSPPDFLSGSPCSSEPGLLGAHYSCWTSVSGVHCSSLLSRLREVQSGDDSVLEVWFQTPMKFWVHPPCVVVGTGNLTENERFFSYLMGACCCVCMLCRL